MRTRSGRLAAVVGGVLGLVLLVAPVADHTRALFSDSAAVGTGSFTAGQLARPSTLGCTNQSGNVLISWTTPTQPQFRVRVFRGADELYQTTVTTNSVVLRPGLLSELLGGTHTVEVRTQLPGTPWVSAVQTRTIQVVTLGLGLSCT